MEKETKENKPQESYQFITEKRKHKPVNFKKLIQKILFTIVLAVLFGATAAAAFVFIVHKSRAMDVRETVDFTREEVQGPASENATVSSEELSEPSQNSVEVIPEEKTAVSAGQAGMRVITNRVVEKVSIGISDYKRLYEDLYQAAQGASRSIVTVKSISSDTDWFENVYENTNQASGLILADNGRELLIVVDDSIYDFSNRISVEFSDGTRADGTLGKMDPNTGLMIIGVELSQLSDETREAIREAELGNTLNSNISGEPVIAIGSPLGSNSLAYGFITSVGQTLNLVDRNVHLVNTDIYGSTGASGVIVDYNGAVLGIITEQKSEYGTENLISAYAISDLKDSLEKLSNGTSMARLGIFGTDVTEEALSEGVPQGAYVTDIVMDGPAMEAGIQSGDVITRIGTQEITSFNDFENAIGNSQPNDDAVVTVMRFARGDYQEMTFDVTFDSLEEQ